MTPEEVELLAPSPPVQFQPWLTPISRFVRATTNLEDGTRFD